ncbi:hypothetical protein JCM11641_005304 [Rhodosporidiobolus odoratus]
MQRRRQPSTLSSWPTLALFAIYSDEPLLAPAQRDVRLEDAAVEAAKLLWILAPGEDEQLSEQRKGRLMGTVMGVAGFTKTFGGQGDSGEMAVHSSRRRMIWIEPEPGFHVHATIALPRPSRHSRAASAATTSSTNSTSVDSAPGILDDDVLLATLRQGYREYRLRHGSLRGMLKRAGRERLAETLDGFWRSWAEKWDIAGGTLRPIERILDAVPRCSLLTPQTSSQLQPLLTQFATSHPAILPFLLHSSSIVSLPVLRRPAQPSTAEPDTTPAEANSENPPPLTGDDLLALVRLLASSAPSQTTLSVHPDLPDTPFPPSHPLAASSLSPFPTTSSSEASNRWSASLSTLTGGMSSLFTPPSVSLPSLPSMPSMPSLPSIHPLVTSSGGTGKAESRPPTSLRSGFQALRKQEQSALAEHEKQDEQARLGKGTPSSPGGEGKGTGWTLRGVSWSSFGLGAGAAASSGGGEARAEPGVIAPSTVEALAEPPIIGDAAPPTMTATTSPVENADAVGGAGGSQSSQSDLGETSEPTTPAVELAPAVDVEELAEAIGASSQSVMVQTSAVEVEAMPPEEGGMADTSREVVRDEVKDDAEQNVLSLYCGTGEHADTEFSVRRFERGPLTLALAYIPTTGPSELEEFLSRLDVRAERLLEGVESMLDVVVPPQPSYPHRHFVKHGALVSTFSPSQSGSAAGEESESSLALLDSYRSLHTNPPLLESLTRLSTSQWVVHRRSLDPTSPFRTSYSSLTTTAASPMDVFAVLPARTRKGKEASLLDAAEELRRVGRAYFG